MDSLKARNLRRLLLLMVYDEKCLPVAPSGLLFDRREVGLEYWIWRKLYECFSGDL